MNAIHFLDDLDFNLEDISCGSNVSEDGRSEDTFGRPEYEDRIDTGFRIPSIDFHPRLPTEALLFEER